MTDDDDASFDFNPPIYTPNPRGTGAISGRSGQSSVAQAHAMNRTSSSSGCRKRKFLEAFQELSSMITPITGDGNSGGESSFLTRMNDALSGALCPQNTTKLYEVVESFAMGSGIGCVYRWIEIKRRIVVIRHGVCTVCTGFEEIKNDDHVCSLWHNILYLWYNMYLYVVNIRIFSEIGYSMCDRLWSCATYCGC